jgi:hypothetical protein
MGGEVKNITFFYPARKVGGAEFLFIRLAKHISRNYGLGVYVIDYKDGFLRSQIIEKDVHFIEYEEGKLIHIDHPTHLITPVSCLFRVKNELLINEKSIILLWVLHPYNLLSLFPFISRYQSLRVELIKSINKFLFFEDQSKIKSAIRYLERTHALYFMDSACFTFNQYVFDLNREEVRYLPVTNLAKTLEARSEIVNQNEMNIGWLGRISEEKVYSLLNVIENADAYSAQYGKKIVLHIIGEGPKENLIKGYRKKSENLEILFLGTKIGEELDRYLMNSIDVLFAMGTSCFEGAQLKLPTVLVGPSFQRIKRDYKYTWLYNTEGYSLGGYANKENNPHSFDDIMNEIYARNKKGIIGEKNYRYYVDNHSITKVSEMLMNYLEKDTGTLGDLDRETTIFKNSFILKAYFRGVRIKDKIKGMVKAS